MTLTQFEHDELLRSVKPHLVKLAKLFDERIQMKHVYGDILIGLNEKIKKYFDRYYDEYHHEDDPEDATFYIDIKTTNDEASDVLLWDLDKDLIDTMAVIVNTRTIQSTEFRSNNTDFIQDAVNILNAELSSFDSHDIKFYYSNGRLYYDITWNFNSGNLQNVIEQGIEACITDYKFTADYYYDRSNNRFEIVVDYKDYDSKAIERLVSQFDFAKRNFFKNNFSAFQFFFKFIDKIEEMQDFHIKTGQPYEPLTFEINVVYDKDSFDYNFRGNRLILNLAHKLKNSDICNSYSIKAIAEIKQLVGNNVDVQPLLDMSTYKFKIKKDAPELLSIMNEAHKALIKCLTRSDIKFKDLSNDSLLKFELLS